MMREPKKNFKSQKGDLPSATEIAKPENVQKLSHIIFTFSYSDFMQIKAILLLHHLACLKHKEQTPYYIWHSAIPR